MEKTSTYKIPICQGQLLSGAKCSEKVQLLNFEPDHIKVNKPALEEMNRMRNESIFPLDYVEEEECDDSCCDITDRRITDNSHSNDTTD